MDVDLVRAERVIESDKAVDRLREELDGLNDELAAWTLATNADQRQVDWRFTTSDARIKLRHLYPVL